MNLYGFVKNGPTVMVDQDGRVPWSLVVNLAFTFYDMYQFSAGQISGPEYAARMGVNLTALAMDAMTMGSGPGAAYQMAGRAAVIANRAAWAAARVQPIATSANAALHICMSKGSGGSSNWRDFLDKDADELADSLPTNEKMPAGNNQYFNDMFRQIMADNNIKPGPLWDALHDAVGQSEVAKNANYETLRQFILEELGKSL